MSMFKYGIVCGLEDMPSSKPVILRGDIVYCAEIAADIGYDALELHINNPKQYDAFYLKKVADERNLKYCGIATGMEYINNKLSLISDDKSIRRAAINRLKEHLELSAVLNCPVIVGIMRGNIPNEKEKDKYINYHSEALMELSEYAAKLGTSLVVESILRYICNYLNTLADTVDYLDNLQLPNVKLHADTHSMIMEDQDMPNAIRYSKDKMGYVHFTDSNRRYPGGGNVDFKACMKALKEINYEGYIGFECVPYPDQIKCAKFCYDYIKALEVCIEIETFTEK
jgi:sugar phosphate isomerase/epimerase